jgi:hypothetical protein
VRPAPGAGTTTGEVSVPAWSHATRRRRA